MYPFTAHPQLLPHQYPELCAFLERVGGIVLGEGKESLIASRMGKVLRDYRLDSFSELLRAIQSDENMPLRMAVIDAVTAKETAWFRDEVHFTMLQNVMAERAGELGAFRVWSAACSSGQEPYSIGMAIDEYRRGSRFFRRPVEVVATDFSEGLIAEARKGIYCSLAKAQGMNEERRKRYFIPNGDCSEMRPDLRRMVSFRRLNLLDPFDRLGRFDVIFCRNALVYFSQANRIDVIRRMAATLKPYGYLFLGTGESLEDTDGLFERAAWSEGVAYRLKSTRQVPALK
ncbi:MAG: protein-glutamate O-methyltransferase CheR [Gammaproteobacteria bacterium]|nr:protein-glutamate O-methyltransferase CheR [Gammaproteobacteria bacterium]MBU1653730.1 protein-glutamate O-methyltransferase CheR [Gammaproteobacteria bacterium]MBU1960898.1 protein-glutamate O-methyltransferase CheR [Gammaproteobacteria bacterium]